MAVKHLGKKGMFLTFISIAIIAAAIIIFTPSDINLRKDIPVIKTRVSNVNEYVLDLETVYLERTLHVTGRKTLIGLIDYVKDNGFFVDAMEFEDAFSEVLLNGEYNGNPIDGMAGNTYNDWIDKIKTTAQSTFNVDTVYGISDIRIYQIRPWFVNVDADLSFNVSSETASWNKTAVIKTEISVENFKDPYYLVKTGGSYENIINKTNTKFDEWDVAKVNDFIQNGNYTHFQDSDAPSFLQGFYDDVSASSCCGIESFVNPAKVSDLDRVYVGHSYWSSSYPCPNDDLYTVTGLNSEFKLDLNHIIKYNLFSAADLECPIT